MKRLVFKPLFVFAFALLWLGGSWRICAQSNGVLRESYSGINGTAVSDLTNNPAFPNNPTTVTVISNFFEAPINVADFYGQRMSGYLVPPTTGSYLFWVSSDDNSILALSTDDNSANKRVIASVPMWTNPREWGKFAQQQSAPISLAAGQHYYVEALMKEGSGGDNLAVRWQLPDGTIEEPVPASRLALFGPLQILQQPTNVSVVEGGSATFTVQLVRSYGATYRWQRNGTDITGATNASYTRVPVSLTDSNSQFRCFISNPVASTNSSTATLTVQPDTTRPTLVRAVNSSLTSVWVTFSEAVEASSATNYLNYQLSGGIAVSAAASGGDTRTIFLTTSSLTIGNSYTLTVNNVRDRAAVPNTILPNSQVTFAALPYIPLDIGNPAQSGSVSIATNGFDVVGGGNDIGSTTDQFQFAYQQRTGNFDVRVRVQALDQIDPWTKAGLMARASLDSNGVFAGILTTPSLVGSFFESRPATGGTASLGSSIPVNHPYTWLRLQRSANFFTGFASYDGQTWTSLGSLSVTMPGTVYFGMAVTSHNTNQVARARFRDLQDVAGATTGTVALPWEPIGPSSRKSGLVISEIMYQPAPRADNRNLEYIEIFNSNPYYEDISGYRISGDIDYTFPANTLVRGGAFLVVAASPSDVQAVYGITNVAGPYTHSLKKAGTVRLRNNIGAIYLDVPYSNEPPWPVGANGTGHSIVLARPSYGEADPNAWALSDVAGGSPGEVEACRPTPLRSVAINEFLAHTDPPLYDYIELYNHGNQPVDVSGCILSDDPVTNRFVLPPNTTIPARGFVSFDENQMGFRLDATGETIYFKNTNATSVLDAVQFEGQANAVSTGRYPDGAKDFYPLTTRTPGTNNAVNRVRDVVINEIMYNPISGSDDDQYVELYNQGGGAVNLSGWRFNSGISYTFPTNSAIAPGGYLVVARNATNLTAHYANLNANNTVGNFGGLLSHGGERLALAIPEQVINTNTPGVTTTNTAWIVIDEVTYRAGGRWGHWADGGGSSLELIDPRSNHRLADNWADSDETQKAPWTNIDVTAVMDWGSGYANDPINLVQIGLLGEGECLVDNIEFHPGDPNGFNYIWNPDFEGDLTGWTPQGDHIRSSLETTAGYSSAQSLHLRASDSMWTGANCVQGILADVFDPANPPGQTATLRFQARWLKGWPEVLMRVNGNWVEATGRMAIPSNLGTPGARNSRALSNAGPAIYEVVHSPPVPPANQSVVVKARVQDPDGVQSMVLKYRIDPSATFNSVAMADNGTGGDAVAGDGLYSATIPGQPAGTVVAFYLEATDGLSATTRFPRDRDDNGPARECVVYFGDGTPVGAFGVYHLWLTQAAINRWAGLPPLSNEPHEGTWVYGDRVIYNMISHFAGSPYHQGFNSPIGNYCHYHCDMPEDDRLFGATSFNKIHAPGNGPFDDNTIQREQTCYWMVRQLALPWNYRRYVAMYVNGNRRGTLMEDSQVPNGDVIDEYFPDDTDGQLFRLQPWFEFDANGRGFNNKSWCTLNNYTTGGSKKLARYRWNYLTRKAQTTASDYANVFALIDAANSYATSDYVANMGTLADMEEWLRIFAIQHAVGNWDSFGAQNAQNMYGYKPAHGQWNLLIWDYNIVLGNSGSWGPGPNNLFTYNILDTPMGKIYDNPTFRRAYLRAFKEIANGPMLNANVDPVMDAKYAAFSAGGINVTSPAAVKSWIATMRSSLLSTLSTEGANAPFSITSNGGNNFSTNRNVITISGAAPVEVKTIVINGIAYPVTWSTVTGWTATVALLGGGNTLTVQGFDYYGNPVAGATDSIVITYTGVADAPQGHLVINEIMYNPVQPKASFIEIYNSSTNNAFDLSGFRIDGADFTFPGGSIIGANSFFVVAGDPQGFLAAYGSAIPLAGIFHGKLSNGGETLKLVKPGATPAQDLIIAEVTYDSVPPWAAAANGFGPSLQLIDPTQNNNRVANWTAVTTNAAPASHWQYVSVTGTATSSRLYVYLESPPTGGDAYVDDIQMVAGIVPGSGANYVGNGDFETALSSLWNVTSNCINSSITTNFAHAGTHSLHLVCTTNGTTEMDSIWQDIGPLTNGAQYTLSYWYLPNTNGGTLAIRLSSSGVRSDQNIAPAPLSSGALYTPGASNSVRSSLALPLLWLNEVQPDNVTGVPDRFGHHHPWVELYNSGTNTINLGGYSLANNYTNLAQWAFPQNTGINPGQFLLVYLDGNSGESVSNELHAGFVIPPVSGSVVLTRFTDNQATVIDYLNYNLVNTDRSYGAFCDGTPAKRQKFYYATPGGTNNNTWPAVPVTINEWMAANTATLLDSADSHYDDWFELYNAGPTTLDLSGYTLADNPTNAARFAIPARYTIPPGGFLLVWADDDTGQNTTNTPDLHVDFKLSQSGEGIWFFAPNGTNVDGVTFGPQTSDVSQGRWPDGNSGQYYFMYRPTPAAPNVLGTATNQPPVLAPIGNKAINEGSALIFTASATDPDTGQTLTYSLDAGAPAGTTINASSGVFLWTPLEFQGPGNYPVTIRVTDNGSPLLSDTETIAITVNEVNGAPSLTFIDDQFVNQGSTLTFSVFANDPDVPANTLTFSLDPGAPAGASINPSTGLFTWTTAANQVPGATPVTVRVTDNGAPPLGDAQSFDITVNASTELKLTGVGMSNDVMTLRWTSQPGKTYRLEYKDDLDQTNWNALGDFNANDGTLSATNNVNGAPQRYYRVRQLN